MLQQKQKVHDLTRPGPRPGECVYIYIPVNRVFYIYYIAIAIDPCLGLVAIDPFMGRVWVRPRPMC